MKYEAEYPSCNCSFCKINLAINVKLKRFLKSSTIEYFRKNNRWYPKHNNKWTPKRKAEMLGIKMI